MNNIQSMINEFNALVARKENAEKWFDDPKTTDTEREQMTPELLKICNRMVEISKDLESAGHKVPPEAFWLGIKIV